MFAVEMYCKTFILAHLIKKERRNKEIAHNAKVFANSRFLHLLKKKKVPLKNILKILKRTKYESNFCGIKLFGTSIFKSV